MIHKKITVQDREYEVKEIGSDGWVELTCDGEFVAKVIDFMEARSVIWHYWTKQGIAMDYLTAGDFEDVQ